MTQKRRRPDSPQGSARTMPSTPSNGNSGRDPSLEAAIRALLAEDEPDSRPPAPANPPPSTRRLTLTRPVGVTKAQALAGLKVRGR